eukprot:g3889.t1
MVSSIDIEKDSSKQGLQVDTISEQIEKTHGDLSWEDVVRKDAEKKKQAELLLQRALHRAAIAKEKRNERKRKATERAKRKKEKEKQRQARMVEAMKKRRAKAKALKEKKKAHRLEQKLKLFRKKQKEAYRNIHNMKKRKRSNTKDSEQHRKKLQGGNMDTVQPTEGVTVEQTESIHESDIPTDLPTTSSSSCSYGIETESDTWHLDV